MSISDNCELLSLSIKDLFNMKKEFCDCYDELFDFNVNRRLLGRALKLQCRAIKHCKKQIRDQYLSDCPDPGNENENSEQLKNKWVSLTYDRVETLHHKQLSSSNFDNTSSSISETITEESSCSSSFKTESECNSIVDSGEEFQQA